jgi:hypothetical protein
MYRSRGNGVSERAAHKINKYNFCENKNCLGELDWITSLRFTRRRLSCECQSVSFFSLYLSVSLCLSSSISLFFFPPPFLNFLLLTLHFIFSSLFRPRLVVSFLPMLPTHPLDYVISKISFYYTLKYELDEWHKSGRGSSCVSLLPSARSQSHLIPMIAVRRELTSTWGI